MAKKVSTKKVTRKAHIAAPKKITAEDIVAAVQGMSTEDKVEFASVLGVVPGPTGASNTRTVTEKKTVLDEPFVAEIADAPKPEPEPAGALFRSKHNGFWQLLTKSKKVRLTDDDYEIIAPHFAEFMNGTWRASSEEEADLMRAKIAKKRRRGGVIEVAEIKDAEVIGLVEGKEVQTIKSKSGITADTPADGVDMTPGFTPEQLAGMAQ